MNIIGIDPGLTGAVSFIGNGGVVVATYDTPIIEIVKGKNKKHDFLPLEMANLIRRLTKDPCHVFIEQVNAMPGQGVTSMFNFGKGYGMWVGILAYSGAPYSFVTPQAWKKELMQGMRDKDCARLRAQQLFPRLYEELKLKKHIGRADALLIGEYGRRQLGEINSPNANIPMRRRR